VILAINTSTLQFGLALLGEDGTVFSEYMSSEHSGHFGSLMPALHFLVNTSGHDIHDLKALVIAIGPGSFTGLRIGLSTAKGLCDSLEIPIIGISSLEALASQVQFSELTIAPILDSRRGEFFVAQFTRSDNNGLIRNQEDIALRIEDLPDLFSEQTLFIGNDFPSQGEAIKKILGPRCLLAPPHWWNLKPSAVGALGIERFRARDFDDPQTLSPLYLRPPDIRPNPYLLLNRQNN